MAKELALETNKQVLRRMSALAGRRWAELDPRVADAARYSTAYDIRILLRQLNLAAIQRGGHTGHKDEDELMIAPGKHAWPNLWDLILGDLQLTGIMSTMEVIPEVGRMGAISTKLTSDFDLDKVELRGIPVWDKS